MKTRSLLWLFVLVLALGACEKDEETSYGKYPFSWLPVTDPAGKSIALQYPEGQKLEMVLKFKSFADNPVTKVSLLMAEVDLVSGAVGATTKVAEYASSAFTYLEAELQNKVTLAYDIPKVTYTDKKLAFIASIETQNGAKQDRTVAQIGVSEPFLKIIDEVPYFYMYNNKYTNAGMNYGPEQSAGYSAAVMVMNYYGFNPDNAAFKSDLNGLVANHTPDWVADYYVGVWPKILAQNVAELHRVWINEAPYYGGTWTLTSVETGTYADLEAAIVAGKPVIVHGDFRNTGVKHQIVLVGVSERSYLAMDPAGKWDGNKNGEHTKTATAGNYVKYSKEAVKAAMGADGSLHTHIPVPR